MAGRHCPLKVDMGQGRGRRARMTLELGHHADGHLPPSHLQGSLRQARTVMGQELQASTAVVFQPLAREPSRQAEQLLP